MLRRTSPQQPTIGSLGTTLFQHEETHWQVAGPMTPEYRSSPKRYHVRWIPVRRRQSQSRIRLPRVGRRFARCQALRGPSTRRSPARSLSVFLYSLQPRELPARRKSLRQGETGHNTPQATAYGSIQDVPGMLEAVHGSEEYG